MPHPYFSYPPRRSRLLALLAWTTAVVLGHAPETARAQWELLAAASNEPPAAAGSAGGGGGAITHVRRTARDAASGREATVHLVLFDSRRATFRVLDQPSANERASLGNFLRGPAGNGTLAAVNGGYFHPDYAPLGLLVSDGRTAHGAERASLLSGLLLVGRDGAPSLVRYPAYRPGNPVQQALQAGPFLVDNGQPVAGLNTKRAARRTAVLTDGRGRWALAAIPTHLTLAETGALLARPNLGPEGFTVRRALNLDGGSSTALWVRGEGSAEPNYEVREWGTVRNFLAVVPR